MNRLWTLIALLALVPGLAAMVWALTILFSLYYTQPVVQP